MYYFYNKIPKIVERYGTLPPDLLSFIGAQTPIHIRRPEMYKTPLTFLVAAHARSFLTITKITFYILSPFCTKNVSAPLHLGKIEYDCLLITSLGKF